MRYAACIFALLVVLTPLSATAAAAGPAVGGDASVGADAVDGASAESDERFQLSAPEPHTTIRVHLHSNRNARWVVSFKYRLESENETAAFRRLREQYASGTAAAGPNVALFRTAAQKASTVAGREMRITNVNRTGSVNGNVGVLTLTFTWTNFLERQSDGTLRLGDAFRTPGGGRWISSLEEGQQIVLVTPDGYTVNSTGIRSQLQNNSVVIGGPRSLPDDEQFVVVYRETAKSQIPWLLVGGGGVLVGAVAAAFFYLRRDESSADEERPPAVEAPDPTGVGVGSRPDAPESDGTHGVGPRNGPAAGPVTVNGPDEEAAEPEVESSLLSDEERVERLLERNGGRMKQANIVKQTGWSDAKVSQLLSAMTDEGRVEKLRLGRENLISLPSDDGEDA